MRFIDLEIIKNDKRVKKWEERAKRLAKKVKAATSPEKRKSIIDHNNIWSDLKPILVEYFGETCWYSDYVLTGSFSDVDHFRPKNLALDMDKNVILDSGYWWLAYDYKNYRLSCEKCNRPFGAGGKRDYFPLREGTAPAKENSSNDDAMLLDPCVLSDVALIDCDETGRIISLSEDEFEKKRVSISNKLYNWDLFSDARKKAVLDCKQKLEAFEYMYELGSMKGMEKTIKPVKTSIDNSMSYSSFALRFLLNYIEDKPYQELLLLFIGRSKS